MMVDKAALNAQLPIGRDPASKQTRSKLFSQFDPNGNGILSLAEVDRGLKQVLHLAGVEECTPAINRAFAAAREIAPPVSSFSNDYIDKNEFRVLFVYLRHYIELWELFCAIDTSHDRRVRLPEFQAAIPKLKQWGIKEASSWQQDAHGAFSLMDKNDGGVVLFDEFADFVLRAGLRDLGGDDFQDRKEALEELKSRKPNLANRDLPQMRELPRQNVQPSYPSGSLSARSPPQARTVQPAGGAHVMGSQAVGQALGALTLDTSSTRWHSTYKRTFRNPPDKASKQHGMAALQMTLPLSSEKSPLREQLHQQMAMYSTGQLQDMLKSAGGMVVAAPGPRQPLSARV
jgi:Ca2+-binding EF-hand superfamily protein